MMKRRLVTWCVLSFALVGCASTDDAASRWRVFPSGEQSHWIQSFDDHYLWMKGGLWCGEVQQYDMAERRMNRFTSRDGLPLNTRGVESLVAGDDERCLLILDDEKQPYLWTQDVGWQRLPELSMQGRDELADVAFDTDGRILALVRRADGLRYRSATIHVLDNDQWLALGIIDLPYAARLLAFPDAYMLLYLDKGVRFARINRTDMGVDLLPDSPGRLDTRYPQIVVLGDSNYLVTTSPMRHSDPPSFPPIRTLNVIRQVTADGLVQTSSDRPLFIDLADQTFKPMNLRVLPERRVVLEIPGVEPLELDARSGLTLMPVRDRNGDIWLGKHLYRDGRWMSPYISRSDIFGSRAANTARVRFNDDEDRWVRTVPVDHDEYSVVDPAGPIAWVLEDYKSPTMQLIDFGSCPPKVLRQVQREEDWGLPRFEDREGNWWMWRWNVIRLAPDGTVKRMTVNRPPDLWMIPATGEVWTNDDRGYLRFDPATDAFIEQTEDAFFEAMSFKVGGNRYAIIPGEGMSIFSMRKRRNGEWIPIGEGAVHRDRILINDRRGVWEYDASRDRLVRLHDTDGFDVAFDSEGRRLLANHHVILLYDGDPFTDPNAQQLASLDDAEHAVLVTCIKLLHSPHQALQDYAEKRLKALSPLIIPTLESIADDPTTPAHVRAALNNVAGSLGGPPPPSLFELTFPSCPVIQPAHQ
jgi:hypothetical protein